MKRTFETDVPTRSGFRVVRAASDDWFEHVLTISFDRLQEISDRKKKRK
jgi:hypothetical protein